MKILITSMLVLACNTALAQFGGGGGFASVSTNTPPLPVWTNTGSFHQAVSGADRIVVRDGGFDCCHPVTNMQALVVLSNAQDIVAFNSNLQFVATQEIGFRCMCCGYPGIDWYKGTNLLAFTAIQHGTALRWKGFPTDIALKEQSSVWLVDWLLDHGIKGMFNELVELKAKRDGKPSPREQEAKDLIDRGKELLAKKQLKKALTEGFLRATLTHSDTSYYPEAAFHAARVFEMLDRRKDARRLYMRLVSQHPKDSFSKQAQTRLKQMDEAQHSQQPAAQLQSEGAPSN